ncbi:MAG: heparinase II/III family protein [Clostridia bacterium]|nr:heparinase II/III family protein [Clostridia bacterium]
MNEEKRFFSQQRVNVRQLFPFPENGRLVEENPPCLSWLRPEGNPPCTVLLWNADGKELWRAETEKNYIVPPALPAPGEYRWNVYGGGMERGEWRFTLSENAVSIHRVTAEELYDRVPDVRPRHLFFAEDIAKLIADRPREVATLRRNIEAAYENGMPQPPRYHRDPDALPYREYFGRFRDYCDRDLVACALGYALLGDEKAGTHAKELLLCICDWNPFGPCDLNGPWGDEIGLSLARCLPAVFDLLYPLLNEKERTFAARTVKAYGYQCWLRLKRLDFCANPGDSHAGRIPAYLGEAALSLKGTGILSREDALAWLDYALDIYGGIFPYYGTPDGGWAEGVFYASSYTRWYLPFFCAVERYSGCRFLDRPFYQRLTQYFLHFAGPDFENHPFGDGYWCHPEDIEWPGFFAQNPCRLYAHRFGPALAKERAEKAAEQPLYLLHLLDVFIPAGDPPAVSLTGEAENVQCFPDAGFVSLHTDLADTEKDFALLARASRFGSDSHRHPDQGSFALFCGGKALISPSGYFGRAYGTKHHREWLNSTRAHNAILVDGEGQPTKSLLSVGKILFCRDEGGVKTAKLDMSTAYASLTAWTRTFTLTANELIVEDHIEADHPVAITYPLHTLVMPQAEGNSLIVERENVRLTVQPIAGDLAELVVTDKFAVDLNEGEPEQYHVTMPPQFHAGWTTPKKQVHDITVRYTIAKK